MQDSTFRAPTPGHTPELRSTGVEVRPDSGRVVARLFVPGLEEVGPTGSRAGAVISTTEAVLLNGARRPIVPSSRRSAHWSRTTPDLVAAEGPA